MIEPSRELPLQQRIGLAIGASLRGYTQEGQTWMQNSESAVHPLSTALTLQPSRHDKRRSFVVLSLFFGSNPPTTSEEWNARRHLGIRLEFLPEVLRALGEREEAFRNLPRALVTEDPDKALNDAEKIARIAKTLFGKLQTPDEITALADNLERTQHGLSGILGITDTGRQILGK